MQTVNHISIKTPDAVRNRVLQRLQQVSGRSLSKTHLLSVVAELEVMIESLPLASGIYCVARNRLRNARRYLRSDERGAAKYELRLLMGDLRECSGEMERRQKKSKIS